MTGERLDDQTMALRASREFQEGMVINLGIGLPSLCANLALEKELFLHSENGVIGFGPIVEDVDVADIHLINASGQPVLAKPGMALVDQAESFCIVRSGRIDVAVLGALEVSERGDLANYHLPGKPLGSLGGGQDIAFCARRLIALMHHGWRGTPRVVAECSLPVTAPACVDLIVTDIAVIEVTREGLLLTEVAPGWTAEDVQAETAARLIVSDDLRVVELL